MSGNHTKMFTQLLRVLGQLALGPPTYTTLPTSDHDSPAPICSDSSSISSDDDTDSSYYSAISDIDHDSTVASSDSPISSNETAIPTVDTENETDDDKDDSPRLPTEIMEKIFKHANDQDPSTLLPCLRTSKLNYHLAMPILYDTIHLNRDTLPGLAKLMSVGPTENKKKSLEQVTTLVIDDICVMFGFKWEQQLKDFCESIVLPNVTKVIWKEEKKRECDSTGPKRVLVKERFRRNVGPDFNKIDFKFQIGLPRQFVSVLPAKEKEVHIITPPSGRFQEIGPVGTYHLATRPWRQFVQTTDRVMGYVKKMSGTINLHIHQPVHGRFLTLGDIPNTTYHFYPFNPLDDISTTACLLDLFEHTINVRLGVLIWDCEMWKTDLEPTLRAILFQDLAPEAMLKKCEEAIRNQALEWSTSYANLQFDVPSNLVETVKGVIHILNLDNFKALE
jgi:hypothetical protein